MDRVMQRSTSLNLPAAEILYVVNNMWISIANLQPVSVYSCASWDFIGYIALPPFSYETRIMKYLMWAIRTNRSNVVRAV